MSMTYTFCCKPASPYPDVPQAETAHGETALVVHKLLIPKDNRGTTEEKTGMILPQKHNIQRAQSGAMQTIFYLVGCPIFPTGY